MIPFNNSSMFVHALTISAGESFSKLAQPTEPTVGIKVPVLGTPLTPDSKIVDVIHKTATKVVKGQGVKRTIVHEFSATVLDGACAIVETVGNRRAYLDFLVNESSSKYDKTRARANLATFNSRVAGLPDHTPIWCACKDNNGKVYVSSSGIFMDREIAKEHLLIGGTNLQDLLTQFVNSKGGVTQVQRNALISLVMQEVQDIAGTARLSDEAIKKSMSLTGMILTTRGLVKDGFTRDGIIAEWNSVVQPLVDKLSTKALGSWELPWALSSFKGIQLTDVDRLRANVVGPYLTCALGILATSASSIAGEDVRFITAVQQGQWNFTNNTYTVRVGSSTIAIDPTYNDMVAAALAMDKSKLGDVAKLILDAASVYGQALGDGSSWASALYAEWLGITGVIGGLAINASN